ncbi:MAG: hypothetical protein HKN26_00750, partial [Acidimicrobiales bacterium]|nr:hypothetical protein [Acidimicrobiales bacterium]
MWYSPHYSPTGGFPLRYCLTALMAAEPDRVWTVRELVTTIERYGIVTDGRPS